MYLSVHRPSALSGHSAQSALSHRAVTFPCHTTLHTHPPQHQARLHNVAFSQLELTPASLSLRFSPLRHIFSITHPTSNRQPAPRCRCERIPAAPVPPTSCGYHTSPSLIGPTSAIRSQNVQGREKRQKRNERLLAGRSQGSQW